MGKRCTTPGQRLLAPQGMNHRLIHHDLSELVQVYLRGVLEAVCATQLSESCLTHQSVSRMTEDDHFDAPLTALGREQAVDRAALTTCSSTLQYGSH